MSERAEIEIELPAKRYLISVDDVRVAKFFDEYPGAEAEIAGMYEDWRERERNRRQ